MLPDRDWTHKLRKRKLLTDLLKNKLQIGRDESTTCYQSWTNSLIFRNRLLHWKKPSMKRKSLQNNRTTVRCAVGSKKSLNSTFGSLKVQQTNLIRGSSRSLIVGRNQVSTLLPTKLLSRMKMSWLMEQLSL